MHEQNDYIALAVVISLAPTLTVAGYVPSKQMSAQNDRVTRTVPDGSGQPTTLLSKVVVC